MAVLLSIKAKGQTREGYDGVLAAVKERIQKAPGFIMHCARPGEGEWEVTEVWRSKEEANKWFAEAIVPNLPPGIHPKVTFHELHSVVTSHPYFM